MPEPHRYEGRTVDSAVVFGRCLQFLRRQAQLSQLALAADLRISGQALSQIESGTITPTFRLLLDIGGRLNDLRIIDHTGELLAFMDGVSRSLRRRGVEIVNGPLAEGELGLDVPQLDVVVAAVWDADQEQRYEIVPVRVITQRRRERG